MKLWGWLGTRRRLRINMLVPEPHPGAGGDIGLFRIADYLAEFGHDVWVYVVSYISMNDYTTEQVRDYMREHFPRTRAIYHKWSGSARAADCTLATFWPTVANVVTAGDRARSAARSPRRGIKNAGLRLATRALPAPLRAGLALARMFGRRGSED